jgi:hypothetical protein
MSLPKLNPVEPPWYGPVCPVVGEGWHREVPPYPDPRRIAAESVMHLLPNRRLLLNLFSLPWPTRLHADHREKRRRYGLAGRDLALMISKIGHRQRTPRRSSCAISIISARV